ncbi:MAG: hypothetical protein M9885_05645 [Burkholderiaceae bacterium]|nr:hypothetical protein [Burkholderiaceae bacterium]
MKRNPQDFRRDIAPWWPAERRHVDNGYRELPFRFARLGTPAFAIETRWSVDRLLGHLHSSSSVVRFRQSQALDPVEALESTLPRGWGVRDDERTVRWPLTMLCGRVDSAA